MGLYLSPVVFWIAGALSPSLTAPALWSLVVFTFGLAATRAESAARRGSAPVAGRLPGSGARLWLDGPSAAALGTAAGQVEGAEGRYYVRVLFVGYRTPLFF
jgi:hypothetical protein